MLGALLAVGLPLFSFTAGYLIGSHTESEAAIVALAPETAAIDRVDGTGKPATAATQANPEAETPVVREVAVASGDNLMGILVRAGVDRNEAYAAIASLKNVYNPRRDLNVGDKLRLTFGPADETRPGTGGPDGTASNFAFDGLVLPVSYNRDIAVTRAENGGFSASEIERPLQRNSVRASGKIDSSLFVDGRNAGLPITVLVELIRIYSFDVDFQREIQSGDRFEVMYDQFTDEDGRPVHNGDITYAKLILSGTKLPLYRYNTKAGNLDYFNEKGASVRKALMRTPIDGARLSSRFGMRKHPILGYSRLHTGTDFAASAGTPIYAAGNGTVAEIGRKGGYGKDIRLRHNGTYDTAYAHMKSYARGLTRGKRVNQGQVIGYVGTTGRSTGPHLHYEVHRNGKQINPQTLKLPSGEKLKGKELKLFAAHRDAMDSAFAALVPTTPTLIAGSDGDRVTCGGGAPGALATAVTDTKDEASGASC